MVDFLKLLKRNREVCADPDCQHKRNQHSRWNPAGTWSKVSWECEVAGCECQKFVEAD